MIISSSGIINNWGCTDVKNGIRPVVSLKSGVKVEWKSNGDEENVGYYEIVGVE